MRFGMTGQTVGPQVTPIDRDGDSAGAVERHLGYAQGKLDAL